MIVLDLNCSCNIERHRRYNLTLLAESNLRNKPPVMTMNISIDSVEKRDWKRTTRADLIQAAPEVLFTAPEAL